MTDIEQKSTEDLLKEKQELEQRQKEIAEQLKKAKKNSQQEALNKILDLMNTYEIEISDIAIAEKSSKKSRIKSQSAQDTKKPKFPQPPEGKKYFNPETKKSWSGRGPIDDSIRNHPDPDSLLIDK
ncbi:H-NS family nucleoid-associated regulatory protein [Allochromatium palmeri]|uniref:H-NS histone family protein n=1 Tax=Allochromatium palmeri TaxID=231048 RepID=A0A6N8EEF4_9GAMM|nr:H-NS family nucleoid-associated regulatory protein [Allochromatium palmeri]MTW22613.1 H-NS histone family protein [Allochromatium palmeri]